jgi:hypothetical protein
MISELVSGSIPTTKPSTTPSLTRQHRRRAPPEGRSEYSQSFHRSSCAHRRGAVVANRPRRADLLPVRALSAAFVSLSSPGEASARPLSGAPMAGGGWDSLRL